MDCYRGDKKNDCVLDPIVASNAYFKRILADKIGPSQDNHVAVQGIFTILKTTVDIR